MTRAWRRRRHQRRRRQHRVHASKTPVGFPDSRPASLAASLQRGEIGGGNERAEFGGKSRVSSRRKVFSPFPRRFCEGENRRGSAALEGDTSRVFRL